MYSWFILVPLITVIILNLPFRSLMKKIAVWAALLLLLAQILLIMVPSLNSICLQLDQLFALKLNLGLDGVSVIVMLSSGLVLFSALFVGKAIIRDENKLFNFVNLVLIMMMGINGIILATDMFSMYVFIEVVAVTSYILIALDKDKAGLEAVFKYIILSAVASAMMLASIALFMFLAGGTSFAAISEAVQNSQQATFIMIALPIFMCALFIKGGLIPFHGWLPDVYSSAPAAVSMLLAGIVTKSLGIYALIRILATVTGFTDPIKQVLLLVGAISIVAGALAALGQKDFKRMLAYSSISQVGYIVIALGSGTALGVFGAIFHLFNHSVFKTTLFANSAAVEIQTGTRDMDEMGGLAARMPITGITATISSLSAAGMPPLSGFWSKLIIIIALWASGYYVYAAVAIFASVLTLAYFLSLQRRVFWGNIKEKFADIKEANFLMLIPAVLLTLITVILGVFFPWIMNYLIV